MNQTLAKIALDMIARVSIPADDENMRQVSAVRQMLRGIASGELVVGAPVKDEKK